MEITVMANTPKVKQVLEMGCKGLRRTVLLVLPMLLASCAGDQGSAPHAGPPPAPSGPALPQDVARHRVALLVPLSGPNAAIGQSIANAANMAVIETGGQHLRLTIYDTSGGASAAAQKALSQGNGLILGPLFAEDLQAVAPLARAAHVPVVSFSNDSALAGNGVWLMGFTPRQSIARVVSYMHDKGENNFAGLAANGAYGDLAGTALLRSVEKVGGQVVSMQNYDRSSASRGRAIGKLCATPTIGTVMIADTVQGVKSVAPLLRKACPKNITLIGTEIWNTDHSLSQNPALSGALYASVSDGLFAQLSGQYRARFHESPSRFASLGFDAVLLAAKIAPNWHEDSSFPIRLLIDKGGFSGIDGVFRFTSDGTAERGLQVNEIRANGIVVVSPAPQSLGN